jgi:glutamine amidotransferase
VKVGVIDYGSGNFNSLCNALVHLGHSILEIETPDRLPRASHLVLPGVGSFGNAMKRLASRGLVEPIRDVLAAGTVPFLGVCVGMQILASEGQEFGHHAGLDVVAGTVAPMGTGGEALRLPHMGWNDVQPVAGCPLFADMGPDPVFYFVHRYVLAPADPGKIAARCTYGEPFVAAIQSGPTFGVQFHPEKSQAHGLQLLRNFCDL